MNACCCFVAATSRKRIETSPAGLAVVTLLTAACYVMVGAASTLAEDASQPAASEATASIAAPEAASTLTFVRDSVQLTAGAPEIWSLSFSADDRFLAASGGGSWADQIPGQARVWDLGSSKEVASYPTPRGLSSTAMSSDGRRVAFSSWSGDVWLREVGGAELMHEKFHRPLRIAFSPDGKLLVGATERAELPTWDGVTGQRIETNPFRGDLFPIYWVGFSRDGKYLVATGGRNNHPGDTKFAAWNVESREQLYKKSTSPNRIFWGAISPDSQTLATSGENSAVLWDLASGERIGHTDDTGGEVYRVEFSPDGSLLTTAGGNRHDGVISLWDVSTKKSAGSLTGHQSDVYAMAFTRDGKTMASAGADRTVRLWDVAKRQQIRVLQDSKTEPDDAVSIVAVAYSPDGQNVATANDAGEVSVYRLSPPGLLRSWPAHTDSAAALAWSPDGQTLATAGFDKLVKFWNPLSGELVRTFTGHTGWAVSLAFSRDGQTLASGSYDRTIRLWNVADGVSRQTLTGHQATVRSLAFSHDDKLLASASADRTVRLWDTAGGQEQATLTGHQGVVRSVAFSADDRLLASGGEDRTIKVWNVGSHDLRGTLTGHTDMVSAVMFAQQTLVSASWDHTLRTWDADALRTRDKLDVGPSEVVALAGTPDGTRLLSAGADQSLTLWKSKIDQRDRRRQPRE